MLLFCDAVQSEIAIAQLSFDRLRDTMKIAGAGRVEATDRRAFRET
jgi:hypothetical protein